MSVFTPARFARSVLDLVNGFQVRSEFNINPPDDTDADDETESSMEENEKHKNSISMDDEGDPQAKNPVEVLPAELFEKITKYLSVEDLKNCRLISIDWPKHINRELVRRTRLSKNVYHVLRSHKDSTALASLWGQNGIPLDHHTLRISGFMCSRDPLDSHFTQWLNRDTMKTVRCLELPDSQFSVVQLIRVLSAFDNLDVFEFGSKSILGRGWNILLEQAQAQRADNYVMEVGKIVLSRLKVLRVKCDDPSEFFESLNSFGMLNFLRLEELDVNGSCGFPNFKIGMLLARWFLNNCETWKVLKLDCESRRGLLDDALAIQDYGARQVLAMEFRDFLKAMESNKWTNCGLDLTELSLQRFGVAEMSDARVDRVLYPFLRTLTHLQKFSLSQAFFFGNELDGIERLLTQLPPTCKVSIETTHVFAHQANPTCFEEMLDFHKNIAKYKDTWVKVEFGSVSWKILYCTWNTVLDQPVLNKHGQFMTKFKINEAKFPIGDNEMQYIISECPRLQELYIDLCDLSKLSDCGLTGLSRRAVTSAHMTSQRYALDLVPTDYIGLPMHRLTDLRSLTLGNIGDKISNLSISLVFVNFSRLRKLLIRQFPMTLSPAALKNLHDAKAIDLDYVTVASPNAAENVEDIDNQY